MSKDLACPRQMGERMMWDFLDGGPFLVRPRKKKGLLFFLFLRLSLRLNVFQPPFLLNSQRGRRDPGVLFRASGTVYSLDFSSQYLDHLVSDWEKHYMQ